MNIRRRTILLFPTSAPASGSFFLIFVSKNSSLGVLMVASEKSGAILVPFKPGNDEIRGRNAAVQAALAAECEEK